MSSPMALQVRRLTGLAAKPALIAAAVAVGTAAFPAAAQDEDYRAIVTIMRACAQIEDVAARVMCYDNNIRPPASASRLAPPAPATPAVTPPLSQGPARAASPSTAASPAPQASFGSETLPRSVAESAAPAGEAITARVTEARLTQPGIYLLSLADGTQWRFTDAAPTTYDPPRSGDEVTIERGALGSYLMRYNSQRAQRMVRVR